MTFLFFLTFLYEYPRTWACLEFELRLKRGSSGGGGGGVLVITINFVTCSCPKGKDLHYKLFPFPMWSLEELKFFGVLVPHTFILHILNILAIQKKDLCTFVAFEVYLFENIAKVQQLGILLSLIHLSRIRFLVSTFTVYVDNLFPCVQVQHWWRLYYGHFPPCQSTKKKKNRCVLVQNFPPCLSTKKEKSARSNWPEAQGCTLEGWKKQIKGQRILTNSQKQFGFRGGQGV